MEIEISLEEILDSLNKQKEFFISQKTKDINFRIEQLKILKKAIKSYENKFLESLYKDLGKNKLESYETEIGYIYNSIDLMLKNIRKWSKTRFKRTPFYLWPAKSYLVKEAYGNVLIIGPYNYPMQLVFEPLIGAMSAGNTAIIKPSELTPHTSKVIKTLIKEYFPENYITCFEGGIKTNENLLKAPFNYIFFTGSQKVGKIVMKAAAENLIPISLELGGKSPVIVDKTANIKNAAKRIIWGKTLNAGQTCVAPDYLIAHQAIKDDLIAEMKKAIKQFYGSDIKNSPDFGRIVNERHFLRLSKILEEDKDYIIFGGSKEKESLYIEPTILDLDSENRASMEEELFGPILPVLSYNNLSELIKKLNAKEKPLSLYIFTTDNLVKELILNGVSSGGVSINDTISHVANPYLPFGGVGHSGMGKYHGIDNFKNFSHEKAVYERASGLDEDLKRPPYTDKKFNLIKKIFK
ncbi:MAG: aldehyde dehydrogenase [Peptoniphilaceae bacterium]